MTEQDLIDLGFTLIDVPTEESGGSPFTYYTYDFDNELGLISNSDDEAGECNWTVEIFDYSTVKFTGKEDLEEFINIIKKNITH
jgi:hypothetical protein